MTDVAMVTEAATSTDWWANAAVVAAGVITALIASAAGVVTYLKQKHAARRDERAKMYATAIQAVEDYLECPYRIQRRDGSDATRTALTNRISDIQSTIAYHQALVQVHGSDNVAAAYDAFVEAARMEAGAAMTKARSGQPSRSDDDVPLGMRVARPSSDEARERLVQQMKSELS